MADCIGNWDEPCTAPDTCSYHNRGAGIVTADDSLLADVGAYEISGPPKEAAGRWDGGNGPGGERAAFRPRGAQIGAQAGFSTIRGDEGNDE